MMMKMKKWEGLVEDSGVEWRWIVSHEARRKRSDDQANVWSDEDNSNW